METATSGVAAGGSLDPTAALFSVKEEPLDFDLMVKVEQDLGLDLSPEEKKVVPCVVTTATITKNTPVSTTATAAAASTSSSSAAALAVPQIGSSNSAFQPYKQQSLTILTNLQRGNVKTTNKENGPETLTFHEKAAKATLTDSDITESTVNAKDPNGFTPLMWAAFHGRLHIVQKLIEKGAQLDCYGPDGETALMFSACNGHTEVLNYLLTQGSSPDTEDDAGNTALMFAAYGNHAECATSLLRRGANMSKPNGIGDTPFDIAINKGHLAAQYAMEDFLREKIELSLAAFSSADSELPPSLQQQQQPPATQTNKSNNLNNITTNSNNSSSASIPISNGGSDNGGVSLGVNSNNHNNTSIVLIANCNGVVENGAIAFTTQQPSS